MRLSFPPGLLFVSLLFVSCTPKIDLLKEDITQELAKQPGEFAVAFADLSTGERLLLHEHDVFHAASTMKTPVMIEVYKQAAAGKFRLDDSVIVKNEFKSIVDSSLYSLTPEDDSEHLLYTLAGTKKTIYDLVYDMIIVSSNLATNNVVDLVGAKQVTQTMRELGAKDIQVLRGVEDDKAFELGMNNTTTAYDLMLIFEKMANGETVDQKASETMINILLDQKFNEIIPAKLPPDVKVAHKTGGLPGINHDSGIVFLPDGRKYILVMLSKGRGEEAASKELMANVSEMIYKHITETK